MQENNPINLPFQTKNSKTKRPWGTFEILCKGPGYQAKILIVLPKGRLSLQTHKHRDEQWIIARGTAKITIGKEQKELGKGEAATVPRTVAHRIENISEIDPLEIIEVQLGDYIDEDDIERIEDDYGR
jgi:mannose-1-phosphate guanylyltransferase / mannose-6-phosphate isomerase